MRNPYSVKSWLRYIEHKTKSKNYNATYLVFERALKLLSGSYKIWYKYLTYRRSIVKLKPINDVEYEELNNVYERALAFMHKVRSNSFVLMAWFGSDEYFVFTLFKMPRIWIDYCEFLSEQCVITRARKAFDRALRSLPITQHSRIWPLYIKLVNSHNIPDTGVKVYRRYLKVLGSHRGCLSSQEFHTRADQAGGAWKESFEF
jgi:pre-mRNA-splicing factor SYF1